MEGDPENKRWYCGLLATNKKLNLELRVEWFSQITMTAIDRLQARRGLC